MLLKDIAFNRLHNQGIIEPDFKSARDVVKWMGAMQAQDFAMSKWAVGLRLPGSNENLIEKAIDKGEILRTHVLRPTWHLVSADDIGWMIELTAPHILSSMKSRHNQLEFTGGEIKKCFKLIENMFREEKNLTGEELFEGFRKAKIETGDNRAYHILMLAELNGLICSGQTKNKNRTYALFERRVTAIQKFTREEALGKLALIYFTSHGPAAIEDFIWWSGLPVKDSRNALESVKTGLLNFKIGSAEYWYAGDMIKTKKEKTYLLPAYDEFIISYKNRSAVLASEDHQKAISKNGMFWPVIINDGKVAGIWKRTIKKDIVEIKAEFFNPGKNISKKDFKTAAEKYAAFSGKELIKN